MQKLLISKLHYLINYKLLEQEFKQTWNNAVISIQLVDEIIFKFTHIIEIGWMLPNIPPTGKCVEIPLVVIVGFANS